MGLSHFLFSFSQKVGREGWGEEARSAILAPSSKKKIEFAISTDSTKPLSRLVRLYHKITENSRCCLGIEGN